MKSAAKLFKDGDHWVLDDGMSSGRANTIEGAQEAYYAAKQETEAFRPIISQDAAYELLEALNTATGWIIAAQVHMSLESLSIFSNPVPTCQKAISKAQRGQS